MKVPLEWSFPNYFICLLIFSCGGSWLLQGILSSCGCRDPSLALGCRGPSLAVVQGPSLALGAGPLSTLGAGPLSSCGRRPLMWWFLLLWSLSSGAHRLQSSCLLCSLVAVPRLQSTDSTVVARRLSCFKASGIFPNQGSNSCLLNRQADSLPLSHQGSPRVELL